MLERLVADVLVRVLGSYVDGLNKESVSFGVWAGDLELRELRLRPEALAVLFENWGQDLPVTVTAGYVGLLRLEVPWKNLRSAPVRIVMNDVTVVASPVSDGDQTELTVRDKRLKRARLEMDEAVREARFGMRLGAGVVPPSAKKEGADAEAPAANTGRSRFSSLTSSFGMGWWQAAVDRIVDNIQVDVENVIVQYEDASSVRGRPYTATLGVDSLKAWATDSTWKKKFLEEASPVTHNVVNLEGLVLNWEPGIGNNPLREWILDSSVTRTPGHWAGFVRDGNCHAILPLACDLRISRVKKSALAEAMSSRDESKQWLVKRPAVEMDLHFPDVGVCLDDFNYHTLLSTVSYLSDIDRRVRPKDPLGRWYWALDRLLPRFKERREATLLLHNADGLRRRRELREAYCKARNSVLSATRKGATKNADDVETVGRIEAELSYDDILLFRDISDAQLLQEGSGQDAQQTSTMWSYLAPWRRRQPSSSSVEASAADQQDGNLSSIDSNFEGNECGSSERILSETPSNSRPVEESTVEYPLQGESFEAMRASSSGSFLEQGPSVEVGPSFRMAILLQRGVLRLSQGGFVDVAMPVSSLEFTELRLGIATAPGFLLEAVLGNFEAVDLRRRSKFMYPRALGLENRHLNAEVDENDEVFYDAMESKDEEPAPKPAESSASSFSGTTGRSYPADVSLALRSIRGGVESYSKNALFKDVSSTALSALDSSANPNSSQQGYSFESDVPLKYIAALRLSKEKILETDGQNSAGNRLAMDLAIGGMEVVLDGPDSAFISSIGFWSPREKLPSIMHLISRSAAPNLARLRMEIQQALLDYKAPMRMTLHIRAPRFVIAPVQQDNDLSIVADMGTFTMDTSTSEPSVVAIKSSETEGTASLEQSSCKTRFTNYNMTFSDLGVFVMSGSPERRLERLVKPFSLIMVVEVLHDPSYVEAMSMHLKRVDLAKVKLLMKLSSLRTSVSHKAFRQLLAIAKSWTSAPSSPEVPIDPSAGDVADSSENAEPSDENGAAVSLPENVPSSPLVSFEMQLDLDNLFLELRDSSEKRIVVVASLGSLVKMKQRPDVTDLTYRVKSFSVTDGSRGSDASYRRLAYAGVDDTARRRDSIDSGSSSGDAAAEKSFIMVSYCSDLKRHEQSIDVKILSLHLVCVRETYLALADFFYFVQAKPPAIANSTATTEVATSLSNGTDADTGNTTGTVEETPGEYSDPFNALGMTTAGAAKEFREKANLGVEISKQAFAQRGKLVLNASLDGVGIVLVSAEEAIASFDVSDCTTSLEQLPSGSVTASGHFGAFGIKDMTAACDVHTNMMRYERTSGSEADGWMLKVPESGSENPWLTARLCNLNIVYLHRFTVLLKQYFDVLRDKLQPVLNIKGGIADVFDDELSEDRSNDSSRLRLNCITENINVILPRHSQSPHEALQFIVGHSAVTNEESASSGYAIGFQVSAENVDGFVLYDTSSGADENPLPIDPCASTDGLTPFTTNTFITSKFDVWRNRRVPQVVMNDDGIPVLQKGEDHREYDPAKWLPAIRVRVFAPRGLTADLCEAQYSILYFAFTENLIEHPGIEFTNIVRGLKTPMLPPRKPVEPIMLSSHRMPPNYQVLFDVPFVSSTVSHGGDPSDLSAKLIRTELRNITGSFEYGVDYRMAVEVSANLHALVDIRPHAVRPNATVISSTLADSSNGRAPSPGLVENNRTVAVTWDRAYGYRANVMVVVSDIRIIVVPELFRDLGLLTGPGFPYLDSSAPAPELRFNGRLLILTVSRPEIWLMAHQYAGDCRSLVLRGDVVAKVEWAAVTGRNTIEAAAHGLHINLSSTGPKGLASVPSTPVSSARVQSGKLNDAEVPLLYPSDISLKHLASGYDPPKSPGGQPTKAPGAELTLNAESLLLRVDVNDIPLILGVGSKLARLRNSALSERPQKPGRFDEWIDTGEDGIGRLFLVSTVPYTRLIFTDETAGHYIPIMELRVRNSVVRSDIPWLTNAKFEFSIDLFNDEKGWWEPGVEPFPIEISVSKGRSGSEAIQLRAEQTVNANITPTTISGATRVAKTLKQAIEDLIKNLQTDIHEEMNAEGESHAIADVVTSAPRPSVAAFCVRNETGQSLSLWLPYDSTKRALAGDGGECEVAMPTEEVLWSAMAANSRDPGDRQDGNRDRHRPMQCVLGMSGYDPLSLSTAEVGSQIVTFFPESSPISGSKTAQETRRTRVLTLVWTVFMRNGAPIGCLRSVFRIVNRTRTVFEIRIGQQPSETYGRSSRDSVASFSSSGGDAGGLLCLGAGESWSVPVDVIDRPLYFRPAIFHAPSFDDSDSEDTYTSSKRGGGRQGVLYTYRWSDPLSKFSSLLSSGLALDKLLHSDDPETPGKLYRSVPVLSCRSAEHAQPFAWLAIPDVGSSPAADMFAQNGHGTQWVDVILRAPFIVSNALPRPMSFAISNPKQGVSLDNGVIAKGWVESTRDFHVHTAGTDSSRLSFGIGYVNKASTGDMKENRSTPQSARSVTGLFKDLHKLRGIPVGTGEQTGFQAKIDRPMSKLAVEKPVSFNATQRIQLYADFWIRNRSSIDLLFRNAKTDRELHSKQQSEHYLRGRGPGTRADQYVAFSGHWVSFRAISQSSTWKSLGRSLVDFDGSIPLNVGDVSILAEVRPAKGEFHRTTIVTIRDAMWIENRTDVVLQWCQPAALDSRGITLSSNVHTISPDQCLPLHWDFENGVKSICLRKCEDNGASDWIWSRPVNVSGKHGEFSAKMYRPKNHQQYIARIMVSTQPSGVGAVILRREDRRTPAYRIINNCDNRSIAFWQSGIQEKSPWLVRPGKSTRYSWDDPQSPLRRRSVTVKVIEEIRSKRATNVSRSMSTSALSVPQTEPPSSGSAEIAGEKRGNKGAEIQYPTFTLNIDIVQDQVEFKGADRFKPKLMISVQVDGPTKVVTFSNASSLDEVMANQPKLAPAKSLDSVALTIPTLQSESPPRDEVGEAAEASAPVPTTKNLDVKLWVHSIGLSFVDDPPEEAPTELAYMSVAGMHFRLDRFDGQQLVNLEVEDIQLDNQLAQCAWPVALWSPPAHDQPIADGPRSEEEHERPGSPKPFFQLTLDGPFPPIKNGIANFRGIFLGVQQLQLAADEEFVLRVWSFSQSIVAAAGGAVQKNVEILTGNDGQEHGISTRRQEEEKIQESKSSPWNRLYVKDLRLNPLKLTVSFTPSRASSPATRIGRFRALRRTLVAVLGNVENAEFRFHALELQHVFDTTEHFQSLIAEFYVSQGANQKMTLLTSNSLIGNPSALFDSIAIGARDFFVEPAKARGSADFIAGIGRGSSSLLTNTVGGIVGSLGGIPRAMAYGLETAVGDKEYLAERESIRGGRARSVASPAQGLYTGGLSLVHGIASGATGLFRDPYQGAVEHGTSGFMKGLRKGVIGGVLKPITGALDLIAEPAAGFQSLMVSERNKNFAEAKRPPRALQGSHRDRLAVYDMEAALGASILQSILGHGSDAKREWLLHWVHFAPANTTQDGDTMGFLWTLLRKNSRAAASGLQRPGSERTVQKASEFNAGLVTSRRVIVTRLDGKLIWEYPLVDVMGTQASLEAREFLNIGLRPVGSRSVVAPTYKRFDCGNGASRDIFNSAIQKALTDFGLIRARQRAALFEMGSNSTPLAAHDDVPQEPMPIASINMDDLE